MRRWVLPDQMTFHETVKDLILRQGVESISTIKEGDLYCVALRKGYDVRIVKFGESPEEALKRVYDAYMRH